MDVDRKAELTHREYVTNKEKQELIEALITARKIIECEFDHVPDKIDKVLKSHDVDLDEISAWNK